MAGMTLNVVPKSDYIFSPMLIPASAAFTLPLAQNVDISRFREGTLIVRVHAAATVTANSTVRVLVRTVAPTFEDPSVFFRYTTSNLASVTIVGAAPAGTLYTSGWTGNGGGMVSVFFDVAYGVTAGALSVTLSVDLSLKD